MEIELKACPFHEAGKYAPPELQWTSEDAVLAWVECQCGAKGSEYCAASIDYAKQGAAQRWNKGVAPAEKLAKVAELIDEQSVDTCTGHIVTGCLQCQMPEEKGHEDWCIVPKLQAILGEKPNE